MLLIVERPGKQVQRLTAETALTKVQAELNKIRAYEDGRKEREGDYKARMDEEHRCTDTGFVRVHVCAFVDVIQSRAGCMWERGGVLCPMFCVWCLCASNHDMPAVVFPKKALSQALPMRTFS